VTGCSKLLIERLKDPTTAPAYINHEAFDMVFVNACVLKIRTSMGEMAPRLAIRMVLCWLKDAATTSDEVGELVEKDARTSERLQDG